MLEREEVRKPGLLKVKPPLKRLNRKPKERTERKNRKGPEARKEQGGKKAPPPTAAPPKRRKRHRRRPTEEPPVDRAWKPGTRTRAVKPNAGREKDALTEPSDGNGRLCEGGTDM